MQLNFKLNGNKCKNIYSAYNFSAPCAHRNTELVGIFSWKILRWQNECHENECVKFSWFGECEVGTTWSEISRCRIKIPSFIPFYAQLAFENWIIRPDLAISDISHAKLLGHKVCTHFSVLVADINWWQLTKRYFTCLILISGKLSSKISTGLKIPKHLFVLRVKHSNNWWTLFDLFKQNKCQV